MKFKITISLMVAAAFFGTPAVVPSALAQLGTTQSGSAQQDEFCAGYVEGYKSIAGAYAIVPSCPFWPSTPFGSTHFREGIKEGIKAACKAYPNKCR